MIYVSNVVVMNKSFLDLIQCNNSRVRGIYGSESVSHFFEVDILVRCDVIYDELESLQLNLFWRPKFLNILYDCLLNS